MVAETNGSALERLIQLGLQHGWAVVVFPHGERIVVADLEGTTIGTVSRRCARLYDDTHLPLSLLRDVTFLLAEVAFESYESREQQEGAWGNLPRL